MLGPNPDRWLGVIIPGNRDRAALPRQGLQRLLLLRSLVTLLSTLGLLILQFFSTISVSINLVLFLLTVVILSVAAGIWRLRVASVISHRELFCHLLADVVILIVLLLNTGGASNPLISYLLVLLAVTATLLPASFVYGFAVGGILIYTCFLVLELGAGHDMDGLAMEQDTLFELHLVGMWVIFVVSAILISGFLTRMASAIRERELNLAQARENEMRNEQLVAIGTLAAGTAHALGTPLSTMAVVLTDLDKLEADQFASIRVKDDINILKQQVTRCKDSLNQLIRYYQKDNPMEIENVQVSDFAGDIGDYINNIHPMANVEFQLACDATTVVTSALSVKHAVINIIENGIKAAREKVTVTFRVDSSAPDSIEISIHDDGPAYRQK